MSLALTLTNCEFECGTDEAGRGCLAGPVTAAAVILPSHFFHKLLDDSKKISEAKRDILRPIIESEAVSFSYSHVFENVIDEINILQASILAMHQSIAMLHIEPNFISVDGNRFNPYRKIPHNTIIKGDGLYMNIAAASVLAKTHRDAYMCKIDKEFPMYNWKQNKGYPTKQHRDAIRKFGISKYHRKSFRLLDEQLHLDV